MGASANIESMATAWFVVVGLLLLGVALAGSYLRRLPLSTTMLYLAVGYGSGPQGADSSEMIPSARPRS